MAATIHRPSVPPAHKLRLREDGYITHDVAELRLPHATGTIRRHVGTDGDVTFTGHVAADTEAAWIDETTEAGDTAEAWAFVVRELYAARVERQQAIFAAMDRHPAGSAR